jgi:hypothetical protein
MKFPARAGLSAQLCYHYQALPARQVYIPKETKERSTQGLIFSLDKLLEQNSPKLILPSRKKLKIFLGNHGKVGLYSVKPFVCKSCLSKQQDTPGSIAGPLGFASPMPRVG